MWHCILTGVGCQKFITSAITKNLHCLSTASQEQFKVQILTHKNPGVEPERVQWHRHTPLSVDNAMEATAGDLFLSPQIE